MQEVTNDNGVGTILASSGVLGPEPEKKPAQKKKDKPNRATRRLYRALISRFRHKTAGKQPLICQSCGLAFIAPTASRCQCKVARPMRAEVV